MNKTLKATNSKIWRIHDMLNRIDCFVRTERTSGFSVTFYHGIDNSFQGMSWSDNPTWFAHDQPGKAYTYRIKSNGIYFDAYAEWVINKGRVEYTKHWAINTEGSCKLGAVPQEGPKEGETVYTFHQGMIRNHLGALPAWAHVTL